MGDSRFLDYRDGLYQRIDTIDEVDLINDDNVIYVDCSATRQGVKCISNHLTSIDGTIHNINDINLNTLDNNYRDKHYFSKYNLSTFLLLVSLFAEEGYEINNKVGRILSLCPDSAYKAYYQPDNFADAKYKRYLLDVLELPETYEVQHRKNKKGF